MCFVVSESVITSDFQVSISISFQILKSIIIFLIDLIDQLDLIV